MKSYKSFLVLGRLRWLFCLIIAFGFACADSAMGGKLVIVIQAANKAPVKKSVAIRSSLPAKITPEDVLESAGLNIGYDVKSDTYYVEDSIEMEPGQIRRFDVVVRDIWLIDLAEVESYRKRANILSSMLSGSKYSADSDQELTMINDLVSEIGDRQAKNGITSVEHPIDHIQAYETNLKVLQKVKHGIGKMENLAMSAGLNPGKSLIGDDITASIPRDDAHMPDEYGEAIMRITVHNQSATRSIKPDIRRDLPPELSVDDVLDSNGLEVRFDPKVKLTYLFKYDLVLAPQETKTFVVRIRDKWNINSGRMIFLQEKANKLLEMSSGRNHIEAVINTLNGAVEELELVMKAKGPTELNPAYIAYYRRQSESIDDIEHSLNRVDAALETLETTKGYKVPAPDKKTTWLIIYVILGFLAVMSLLFFLRWYVRSS